MTKLHLGISQGFHDAGLALVGPDGDIEYASHSERYSKIKNDPNLHYRQFMELGLIDTESVTVNYYERPWLTNLRRLYAGQKLKSIVPVINKLKYFDLPHKMNKWGHHLSHAATAFQTSPFDASAVVIIDSIGEWDTATIWYAYYDDKGIAKYQKLWNRKYPHSIGLFYTAMTDRVGLRPLEDEYVLMGMSAYGDSQVLYKKMCEDFISNSNEIKFKKNFHRGCKEYAKYSTNNDIAYATQKLTELLLRNIHQKAEQLTNESNVCYGGGVALNCAFNTQLSNIWSNVWISPNPGDCGSALGAAALGYGKKLKWKTPFLGHDINSKLDVKEVIDELLTTGIVGVATGRAEWGPRALGNRSLLADPRKASVKDRVNEIKNRQSYRPFAPAILAEHASRYYKLKAGLDYRYMQYAVKCNDDSFLATMHVDRTSRVQLVSKDNSNLRNILEAWYAKTGCPVLLNTSLNIRHQPIVNDMIDANAFEETYGVKVCS